MYPKLLITNKWAEHLHSIALAGGRSFILSGVSLDEDLLTLLKYKGQETIAVGDISVSEKLCQQLLKFVEESSINLVCFSSRDIFDTVLLSRFVTVEKQVLPVRNVSNNFSVLQAVQEKKDVHELVRGAPLYTPLWVYYTQSSMPVKAKLFANI